MTRRKNILSRRRIFFSSCVPNIDRLSLKHQKGPRACSCIWPSQLGTCHCDGVEMLASWIDFRDNILGSELFTVLVYHFSTLTSTQAYLRGVKMHTYVFASSGCGCGYDRRVARKSKGLAWSPRPPPPPPFPAQSPFITYSITQACMRGDVMRMVDILNR